MAGVWNRAVGAITVAVVLVGGACSGDGNDRAAESTKKTEPTVLGSEVTRSSTTTTAPGPAGPPAPSTSSTSTTATTVRSTTTTARRVVTQPATRPQTQTTTRTQTSTVTTTCPSGGVGWRASLDAAGGTADDTWSLHLTGSLTNGANGTVRVSSVSVFVNYSPPAGEQQANPVFTFTPSPADLAPGATVSFDQTKSLRSTTKPTVASLSASLSWADPSVPSSCPPPQGG
jgi:hypothetical protein